MKKLLFTSALALCAISGSAQDEDYELPSGLLAIELQANPFSNDFKTFKMSELKARLFIDNRSVVRLAVGLGFDSDKSESNSNANNQQQNENNYTIYNSNTSEKMNATALKLALGYEYHFANTGRLDFYGGAEAGYEAKFYSGSKVTNSTTSITGYGGYFFSENYSYYNPYTNGVSYPTGVTGITTTSSSTDYKKRTPDGNRQNEHSFFANLFTGVDFYVYKGLYIGTELGVSFKMGKASNGSYTTTDRSQTVVGANTTSDWVRGYSSQTGQTTYIDNLNSNNNYTRAGAAIDNSSKTNSIKIYVEPAIRLGWIF